MGAYAHSQATHRPHQPSRPRSTFARRLAGFTLVELLVTIALVALLMSMAAPALRDFVAKNRLAGISNEFSGSVMRLRSEAIQRNTCVAMCASGNTSAKLPSCSAAKDKSVDWQQGWVMFVNPGCATTDGPADPADLIMVREPGQAAYTLSSSTDLVVIDPRGRARIADAGRFDLRFDSDAYPGNRSICFSAQGRTRATGFRVDCGDAS